MGPFMDPTDAVTPVTGATIGAADQAEVLKENGAATVAMAGTFAAVTDADGWYDYTVASGDVDTVGEVVFVMQDASAYLPVFVRAMVVEEAVYDAMYESAAPGPVRPTTPANTLDVTATGAAGIDWGNVENQTTAVDLSATDIQLADTVTTLTGHTAQTADHTAAIADIPTVSEFNARTLVAASYALEATVAALNDVSTAEVLTQVNTALDTAISELAQAQPTATPTLRTGLMLLYMALRNRLDTTTSGADELQIFNDAGTVIATKALTDDGSDYSEAKMIAGP
jgi:hypothetical protein